MIRGLNHVAISTHDIDRLLVFYRDLLGLRVIHDVSWKAGERKTADIVLGLQDTALRQVKVAGEGVLIELFEFHNPVGKANDPDRPMCDAGHAHFCFTVDDLGGLYETLKGAGTRFHCPPQRFGMSHTATYARDPDGNIVEFIEPAGE